MARTRAIKPGFFSNEQLSELPFSARLLFVGLWTIADRDGRLEDRPKRIKAQIFPYDDVDADDLLTQLHGAGFIVRYESGGERYIAIPTWKKHQNPHIKEAKSTITPPMYSASTMQAPCKHHASTEQALPLMDSGEWVTVNGLLLMGNVSPVQEPCSTDALNPDRVSENLTPSDGQIEAEVQRLDNSSPPPPSHPIVESSYEEPCKISDVNEVAGFYNRAKGTKKLNRSEKALLEQAIEAKPDLPWMGAIEVFLEDDYWRERRFPLHGFLSQASKYAEKASSRNSGEDETPTMVVGGHPDSPIAPRGSNGSIRPSVPIPDKSAEFLARWNEIVSEPLRVKYTDDPLYPGAKLREAAKLPRFTDNFDTIARKCDEYYQVGIKVAFERLFENVKDKPVWFRVLDGFFDGLAKGKQPQQNKSGAQGLLERMKQEQRKKEQIAA